MSSDLLKSYKDHHEKIFKNPSQEFIYYRTYSRWLDEEKRREFYPETINRYISFLQDNLESKNQIPQKVWKKIKTHLMNLDVVGSMRAKWAAGPAGAEDNATLYNCSFTAIDNLNAFSEILYILMCGAGVGFSVEQKFIDLLPSVKQQMNPLPHNFIIQDSRKGWADALRYGINSWFNGQDVEFDYSNLRPKGSRLKTMGGRSSGPEPLKKLLTFTRDLLLSAQGRKLEAIELMDMICEIAEIVVVGGVRRSSLICLSDLGSIEIREAKDFSKGPFPVRRFMANISAVYNEKPSVETFMEEWLSLIKSRSGERGIFNLFAAKNSTNKRRNAELIQGLNPCGEIMLRNKQFCNLSEVIIRPNDDFESLRDKVATAVWLGAMQATFTHFPYLSNEWKANCEEEQLLGVSITGQMDNLDLLSENNLKLLLKYAQKISKQASEILGKNYSTAITTGKPSGTVSQLVNCANGMHPWWSEYFIRRYRISSTDPLFKLLKDSNVLYYPEVNQELDSATTFVVEFPMKAPKGSLTRKDVTAIQQLEIYKKMVKNWTEHNQSSTIYVKDHEWLDVAKWVYDNFEIVNGISFLPDDGGNYKLAPYEEITKIQYEEMAKKFPKIDYSRLSQYETDDQTSGAKTFACVGGSCDI